MRGTDIGVFGGAVVFAVLAALAMQRPLPAPEVERAKEALLDVADLERVHNLVYAKVGEKRWEGEVKPEFMREITAAAVRESGNPFPDWTDIVDWAKKHPEEARGLLEKHLPAASP